MPIACSVCTSNSRARIDAALAEGVTHAAIAKTFGVTASSLGRHSRNHLRPILRAQLTEAESGTTDLTERLSLALHDLSAVRADALASGSHANVIRAAQATASIVNTLAERFGIDDLDTARYLRDLDTLTRSVARATRDDPAVGYAVAHHLRDQGLADDADALMALARQTEIKKSQQDGIEK